MVWKRKDFRIAKDGQKEMVERCHQFIDSEMFKSIFEYIDRIVFYMDDI